MIFNKCMSQAKREFTFLANGVTYTLGDADSQVEGVYKIRHDANRILIWLKTSGTFTQTKGKIVQNAGLFLCGHGATGEVGWRTSGIQYVGGVGGRGGERVTSTVSLTKNTSYPVAIADTTSGFSKSASTGGGSNGGNGAGASNGSAHNGAPGSNGEYAFGDSTVDGVLYGPGGGGGHAKYYAYDTQPGDGGLTGGAQGCYEGRPVPVATANTGGGGGGSYSTTHANPEVGEGAPGATGIIILSIPN